MKTTTPIHELDTETRREYMRLSKRLSRMKARAAAAGLPLPREESRKLRDQMRYLCNKQEYKDKAKIWNERNPEYMRASSMSNRVKKLYPQAWEITDLPLEVMAEWMKDNIGKPCFYCGDPSNSTDHVVPLAEGGPHSKDNLVRCCKRCNSIKATGSLEELHKRVLAMQEAMSNNFPHLVK